MGVAVLGGRKVDQLDLVCAIDEGALDAKAHTQVDEALLEIDQTAGTAAMASQHIDLMEAARGGLNYCDIERRLRKLNAKTYLLAVPIEQVVGKARDFTLVYPQPIFATWNKAPVFAIWYERRGKEAAEALLAKLRIKPSDNQHNLNRAGVPAPASEIHSAYASVPSGGPSSAPAEFRWLFDALMSYDTERRLSDRYNTMLMYASQPFVESIPGLRFSINGRYSKDALQFFVIESDPKRLMSGFGCNCVYLPGARTILCDTNFLDSLTTWVVYGGEETKTPAILRTANDMFAGFLLHWLVGHEIGHFANNDSYDARFLSFFQAAREDAPAGVDIRKLEIQADQFAMKTMPRNVAAGSYMTFNFAIQQLFAQARASAGVGADSKAAISIKEPSAGHPSLLTRAFMFKDAFGLEDFLWDDIRKQLNFTKDVGVTLPSVCSLAAGRSR